MSKPIDLDALERKACAVVDTRNTFELSQWNASHAYDRRRWRSEQIDSALFHIGANSPDVVLAMIARIRELEAAIDTKNKAIAASMEIRAETARERDKATAKLDAIAGLLESNGCDCECGHHAEEHEDDCERCLACRVAAVLEGGR